ncbi:hypothetical protein HY375_02370 [Candidatus Berkelbacteria bacterium]|nr:hypothetical protein [Candidatus Berkelbacteria bacterium]
MSGFSKEQRAELKELFTQQQTWVEAQFVQERTWVKEQFSDQQKWLKAQFTDERAYYRQLIRDELADIRDKLERLDVRADEDIKAALRDIVLLKKRLTQAEVQLAKLQAQH